MKSNLIACKSCGAEIATSAKTCPHCGAKNKKKNPFLIILAIIVILGAIGSGGETKPQETEEIIAATATETETTVPATTSEATVPSAETESTEQASMETLGTLIKTMVSQSYENYTVDYDETGIVINVWVDGLTDLATLASLGNQEMLNNWNDVVAQQVEVCEATMTMLRDLGREDVLVSWNVLNDQNTDKIIIAVMNGALIYDAVNNS